MLYIVSYTLRPKRNATSIIERLQSSPGWAHYLDDTWLISTTENVEELYQRIRTAFSVHDSILIAPFDRYGTYSGWLPEEAWDWINEHRNL